MIINDLMGGLGNQLFQISAGFAHAKKVQTDFAINYKIGSVFNGQGHPHVRYKDNIYKNIPETDDNFFSLYKINYMTGEGAAMWLGEGTLSEAAADDNGNVFFSETTVGSPKKTGQYIY